MQDHDHLVDRPGGQLALGNELGPPCADSVGGDRLEPLGPELGDQPPGDRVAVVPDGRRPALTIMLDVAQPLGGGIGERDPGPGRGLDGAAPKVGEDRFERPWAVLRVKWPASGRPRPVWAGPSRFLIWNWSPPLRWTSRTWPVIGDMAQASTSVGQLRMIAKNARRSRHAHRYPRPYLPQSGNPRAGQLALPRSPATRNARGGSCAPRQTRRRYRRRRSYPAPILHRKALGRLAPVVRFTERLLKVA